MAEIAPLRVSFAGLAHSHPYADAANVLALGGECVGVYDVAGAVEFAERFGGISVGSLEQLVSLDADVMIATPKTQHAADTLDALSSAGLRAPIFFNKVVAANPPQLAQWERAVAAAPVPVGTSSVLRFAPSLAELAALLTSEEVLGLTVRVRQDAAGYRTSSREWQDDPARGGGTLVTVGVHAWEIVDVLVPGAALESGTGRRWSAAVSRTRSEDVGLVEAQVAVGTREIPVRVEVDGRPGPAAYVVEVRTATGAHQLVLGDDDANERLGFAGLIRELSVATARGSALGTWERGRVVVRNTIRAAEISRGLGAAHSPASIRPLRSLAGLGP